MWLAMRNRFPLSTFGDLHRDFDRFFGDFARVLDGDSRIEPQSFPPLSVWEEGDSLYAEVEVPGLAMDDIEIYVDGDELTVKGRWPSVDEDQRVFHCRERRAGEFARVLTLPTEVDADKVEATLRNGVLTVVLPKHPEAQPKRIAVRHA